jgi:protein-L-isoaspartate(D-aspartate) O-methyltransferase
VGDADVGDAFRSIDRIDFLPHHSRREANVDAPVPIGHGQTNSQPRTVRAMLDLLDLQTGHKVLDVGSGSGWTTALLAHIVGDRGEVLGVEREPDLVTFGSGNLARHDYPWATIQQADPDVLGAPDDAPFDRILVSAAARALPTDLVEQLTDDGVMVIPVNATMTRVRRTGPTASDIDVTTHGLYSFVPLL